MNGGGIVRAQRWLLGTADAIEGMPVFKHSFVLKQHGCCYESTVPDIQRELLLSFESKLPCIRGSVADSRRRTYTASLVS
jgi:hypothetical protein